VTARGEPRFSLAGKAALLVAADVAVTAATAALLLRVLPDPAVVFAVSLLVGLLFGLWSLGRGLSSITRTLQALTDGVRSFRDQDFSLRLSSHRADELGELVSLYNEMGDALRAERHDLFQRELLLDTVLQGAPVAITLAGPTGRVVYANRSARDLLGAGHRLEGRAFAELLEACPAEMREALAASSDALFTVGRDGEEETYRTVRRAFHLNTQRHTLYMAERLTPELRRREVEVWKKAIRVMNHELNNSLAPIRSLVHSARQVVSRPEHAHRLEDIFATIEERATHLTDFLEGYARFARLPRPRKEPVAWTEFLEGVRRLCPYELEGMVPDAPGCFDPIQLQQVLINLLKNAYEAGSPEGQVTLSVHRTVDGGAAVQVADRGRGMDEEVMSRALLPFYSSKPAGTGLGLPLCKEILEAHGGGLRLQNRSGGGLVVTCWLPPP
jgi:two-component system nitrogen regulation sensor histidine kinase NtrY